jgi:hypothetical protein
VRARLFTAVICLIFAVPNGAYGKFPFPDGMGWIGAEEATKTHIKLATQRFIGNTSGYDIQRTAIINFIHGNRKRLRVASFVFSVDMVRYPRVNYGITFRRFHVRTYALGRQVKYIIWRYCHFSMPMGDFKRFVSGEHVTGSRDARSLPMFESQRWRVPYIAESYFYLQRIDRIIQIDKAEIWGDERTLRGFGYLGRLSGGLSAGICGIGKSGCFTRLSLSGLGETIGGPDSLFRVVGGRAHFAQLAAQNPPLSKTNTASYGSENGNPNSRLRGSSRRPILGGFLFLLGVALAYGAYYMTDFPNPSWGWMGYGLLGWGCALGCVGYGTLLILGT